jgi:ATP-dependent helicase/nuclease subunit A
MSSPVILHQLDDAPRQRALDPARSFTVRAPAGSGKTELLIQRCLRLLAIVRNPEAIVAITFTRKAAGEMLERILDSLRDAEAGTPVVEAHQEITRALASQALAWDRELGWDLLHHPGRLRVQTIDSLCLSITGEMPWLTRLGGMPRIEDDARRLYEEAAHLTLLDERPEYAAALTTLLRHLDNNAAHARELIATMLARRDQWVELAVQKDDDAERAALEEALARTVTGGLDKAARLIPADPRETWRELVRVPAWPGNAPDDVDAWRALSTLVLTESGSWRKRLDKNGGFPAEDRPRKQRGERLIADLARQDGLLEALGELRKLPPPHYTTEQWEVLRALLRSLRLAVAQLRVVFQERRVIDFIELGMAAREALGKLDNPTELAYRMDSRIEHLLVDEFQDTSRVQFELLTKLTSGWQQGDGRTLFLVGDPMQSIYRFRQAEVGLFLEAEQYGIGGLPLEPLELKLNRRSRRAIVDRVNAVIGPSFPAHNDAETGAVEYTPSLATHEEDNGEVTFDGFLNGEDQLEAECVLRRVEEAHAKDAQGSVAILVRARTHLFAITEALKSRGLPFQAVDIELLGDRTTVRDLLALTRALLGARDRIAWLAILRAPWCGLTLHDLEVLVRDRTQLTIGECLRDLALLSGDGQQRAARVRAILEEAFAEQGRWTLRRWVERAWMRLGGPACLEGDAGALAEAAAYFDLLESEQSGADLRDFDRFRQRVTELYAPPANSTDAWLKVMTIHKAKGLEFDTVILPGLGRLPRMDESPLVLFHEWRAGDEFECLLAPIDETGADKDPLYRYLRSMETRKGELERTRQLYVAATRARKRLHLMGQASLDKNGDPQPRPRSMLADLWGGLTPEELATFRRDPQQPNGPPVALQAKSLRRLPQSWRVPELPLPVTWEGADRPLIEPHEPAFEWVGESLRQAGTVVHALLQRMPGPDAVIPDRSAIRKALAHAGVTRAELDTMAQRVEQALIRIQASPRGRWILEADSHRDPRSEYAVSGVIDGEVVRGLVDRTFIDAGVRWIIDFKTSAHEGGRLESFLDEQQRRYRDQMERYARILAPLGNPVRLGLYFPLLDEWREWAPGTV